MWILNLETWYTTHKRWRNCKRKKLHWTKGKLKIQTVSAPSRAKKSQAPDRVSKHFAMHKPNATITPITRSQMMLLIVCESKSWKLDMLPTQDEDTIKETNCNEQRANWRCGLSHPQAVQRRVGCRIGYQNSFAIHKPNVTIAPITWSQTMLIVHKSWTWELDMLPTTDDTAKQRANWRCGPSQPQAAQRRVRHQIGIKTPLHCTSTTQWLLQSLCSPTTNPIFLSAK